MDSIATARDFFINQQGLSPDQADRIISRGMEAYNERIQPQSMMQMASGGIARLGYQLGGISTMPMDYGQPLQVPQQQQPMFTTTGSATSSPLLNYGQTRLNQAGGTSLSRTGYQEGGLTEFYKAEEPIIPRIENIGGLLDQAEKSIGEPANNMASPLATTFSRFGYEAGGVTLPSQGSELSQMQGMDQQQALQTIIQILIENGIPPEQAQELALQIIQIFAQGGAPAVEAFADQLEQQEQAEAMAGGGIAGYAYRQGYGFGGIGKIFSGAAKAVSGVVKGVASAVKSVAKSPIGRAALTVAAATFLGPGAFGIQGLGLSGLQLGLATAAANAGLQKLGGGKFSLLEAGLSGLSAGLGTPGTPESSVTNITTDGVNAANVNTAYNAQGIANTTVPYSGLEADISGMVAKPTLPSGATNYAYTPDLVNIKPEAGLTSPGAQVYNPGVQTQPSILERAQTGIQNLYKDPLGTIKSLGTGAIDLIEKNPKTAAAVAFGTGIAFGAPKQENESDEDFAKRQQEESNLSLTQLGRNLGIRNPYFYQRYGAVDPFAVQTAADGGIMGYAKGGSMVPPARQIEGGIIELDARKTGGYIPYGKKERVDDVPAMLAKDEFVFTSRAVKAAGGGNARRGAAKMYKLMKQLESKGRKMEQGARA